MSGRGSFFLRRGFGEVARGDSCDADSLDDRVGLDFRPVDRCADLLWRPCRCDFEEQLPAEVVGVVPYDGIVVDVLRQGQGGVREP